MTTLYTRSAGDVLVLFTALVAAPGVTLLRAIVNRSSQHGGNRSWPLVQGRFSVLGSRLILR